MAPTSIDHVRQRQKLQVMEEDGNETPWPVHNYDGEVIHPVFTKEDGELTNRQSVVKRFVEPPKRPESIPLGSLPTPGDER